MSTIEMKIISTTETSLESTTGTQIAFLAKRWPNHLTSSQRGLF